MTHKKEEKVHPWGKDAMGLGVPQKATKTYRKKRWYGEKVKRLGRNTPYKYEVTPLVSVKIHPVFHVLLQDSVLSNPIPGQGIALSPMVIIDNKQHGIEEIVNLKLLHNQPHYYRKWTGYDDPTCGRAKYHADSATVEILH